MSQGPVYCSEMYALGLRNAQNAVALVRAAWLASWHGGLTEKELEGFKVAYDALARSQSIFERVYEDGGCVPYFGEFPPVPADVQWPDPSP